MNKKYLTIAAVLLIVIIGFFFFRGRSSKTVTQTSQPVTISQKLNLPSEWTTVSETDTDVKMEKTVTTGLKPQIVFKKTTSKDATTAAKYVDRVKAGARATLFGLVYQTDKRDSSESTYSALLTGYYFNKGKKIFVDQRLYIQGETVYTFTGSFEKGLEGEVGQILSSLSKEKIGQ